jgi:cytidine deaminase
MNLKNEKDIRKVTDVYTIRGHKTLLSSFPCSLCSEYIFKKFKDSVNIHYYDEDIQNWSTIKILDILKDAI